VPASVRECPICGYDWPAPEAEEAEDRKEGSAPEDKEPLADFVMTEVDLLRSSPFRWESFFDERVVIANGIDAWAAVVNFRGRWVAVAGARMVGMRIVADSSDRLMAMAGADEFMREHGDDDTARKSKSWLRSPPSEKQLQYLGVNPLQAMGMNRYRASCAIQWQMMEKAIRNKLMRLAVPAEAIAA
jgi:DNA repair protein RadD